MGSRNLKRPITITVEENRILETLIQNNRSPAYIAELYKLIEVTKYEKFWSKRASRPVDKYITYGVEKFQPHKLVPSSQPLTIRLNKPMGCFWGSPVGAKFGWKQWVISEDFKTDLSTHIIWALEPGSKILKIRGLSDIDTLPVVIDESLEYLPNIDYNLLRKKFDAVELVDYSLGKNFNNFKARGFSTWDCQSIVVLNPEKIRVIE